jgi:hypothetical protein
LHNQSARRSGVLGTLYLASGHDLKPYSGSGIISV